MPNDTFLYFRKHSDPMHDPRTPGRLVAQCATLVVILTFASLAALATVPATPQSTSHVPAAVLPAGPAAAVGHSGLPGTPRAAGVAGVGRVASLAGPPPVHPTPERSPGGALTAAVASLAAGTGPNGLAPAHCSLMSADSATCAAEPRTPVPAVYSKPFGFQSTSPLAGVNPPLVTGEALAYDANSGDVVFFGGETSSGLIENQTWLYSEGEWINDSAGLAPPARYFGAMSFDYAIGGVILTGGCGVHICPLGDTWEEYGDAWYNLTSTALFLGTGLYAPAMAANGTNGVVLFGGCSNSACTDMNAYTFYFSVFPGVCPTTGDSCWWYIPSLSGPPGREYTSFVADPVTGYDYLYGGYSPAGGTGGTDSFNDTWEYDPATYSWTDISVSSAVYYDVYPNEAEFGMSLFYDPYYGDVFLYGGENSSTLGLSGDFYAFDGSGWGQIISFAQPGWDQTFAPVASTPFYTYPPIMVGGVNSSLVTANNLTWVFEPGLITNASASPLTVETNATVNLFANVTGGSCDDDFYYGSCYGTWTLGDGVSAPGENITTTYTKAGVYTAKLEGYDSYGVSNYSTVTITVTTFTVAASATPTTVPTGTATTFSATPTGGTPAYNYTWHFSDGTVGWGDSVAHAFAHAGTQWGNVTVTDATGTEVNRSVSVDVIVPLSGTISALPSTGVDLGHSVKFTAAGSGGVSPYNYTWSVGSSTGYGPTYVYTPTLVGPLTADVTIKDSEGTTVTKSVTVAVNPPLSAAPTASPSSPSTGVTVTFASGVSGGTGPYTYGWEFGDGGSSALAAPTHSYSSAGTYTVELWVNDSGGGAVHESLSVSVSSSSSSSGLGSSVGGLPVWAWLALVVVIVVVAAVAVLATRRRKARPASPPASPPPTGMPYPPSPPPPGGPPPGAM